MAGWRMLVVALTLVGGCIWVTDDFEMCDTGMATCETETDCPVDYSCVYGTCEAQCQRDTDCPGGFACDSPGYSDTAPPNVAGVGGNLG